MKYIRNLIGQVLLGLGLICIMVPFYSLQHSDFRWSTTIVALVVGVIFILGGTVLIKPPNLRVRPLYWGPAVSGAICS